MGLYINVVTDWQVTDDEDEGWGIYPCNDFPETSYETVPLQGKRIQGTNTKALWLSYHGYNELRDAIAKTCPGADLLVHFYDNEGSFGPIVAGRIADALDAGRPAFVADGPRLLGRQFIFDRYLSQFDSLRSALRKAATEGGIVFFH